MDLTDRQVSQELWELLLVAQPGQPAAKSALLVSRVAQDRWVLPDRLEHQAILDNPARQEREEMLDHQDPLETLVLPVPPVNPALPANPDSLALPAKGFPVLRDHQALQANQARLGSQVGNPNPEHQALQDRQAIQETPASQAVMAKPVSQADKECQEVTQPTAHALVVREPFLLPLLLPLLLLSLAESAPSRRSIPPLELVGLAPAATSAKWDEPKEDGELIGS